MPFNKNLILHSSTLVEMQISLDFGNLIKLFRRKDGRIGNIKHGGTESTEKHREEGMEELNTDPDPDSYRDYLDYRGEEWSCGIPKGKLQRGEILIELLEFCWIWRCSAPGHIFTEM